MLPLLFILLHFTMICAREVMTIVLTWWKYRIMVCCLKLSMVEVLANVLNRGWIYCSVDCLDLGSEGENVNKRG